MEETRAGSSRISRKLIDGDFWELARARILKKLEISILKNNYRWSSRYLRSESMERVFVKEII